MRADKCYVTLQAIIKLKGCRYNNIPQNTLKYSIIFRYLIPPWRFTSIPAMFQIQMKR